MLFNFDTCSSKSCSETFFGTTFQVHLLPAAGLENAMWEPFALSLNLLVYMYTKLYTILKLGYTYTKFSHTCVYSRFRPAWQASPWGHSPSSSAPCAVPMRLSRIDQHIKDEPCAKQRALLGVSSSRSSSVSQFRCLTVYLCKKTPHNLVCLLIFVLINKIGRPHQNCSMSLRTYFWGALFRSVQLK